MTPAPIARFMAAMFAPRRGPFAVLEPAAGRGALAEAVIERWREGGLGAGTLRLVAHEIDDALVPPLAAVLAGCERGEASERDGAARERDRAARERGRAARERARAARERDRVTC